jgi:hypothetical protein
MDRRWVFDAQPPGWQGCRSVSRTRDHRKIRSARLDRERHLAKQSTFERERNEMKGVVFNLLEAVIRREYGEDTWEALLEAADADGAYSSLGNFLTTK